MTQIPIEAANAVIAVFARREHLSLKPPGLIPAAGGVLAPDAGGRALGAVRVTRDTFDADEACALAGVAAAGLRAQA